MAKGSKAGRSVKEAVWAFPDRGESELLDIFECVVAVVQALPGALSAAVIPLSAGALRT